MLELRYKQNAAEVIERLRLLHERRAQDQIFATFSLPSRALEQFGRQYGEGECAYPEPAARIAFWDRLFAEHALLEDDSIPSAYLSEMDQGLYGGMLGGDVRFMAHPDNGWISSMVAPLLNDWSAFDALRIDRAALWFQRYLQQLDTFVRGAAGKFGISHFILIDGLNFAFELVGATNTYESLIEQPEMVRRAVELGYELNVLVQETFFEQVGLLAGGTASNMVGWAEGRVVSESVDPFHMTSVEYFETWGREPVERILNDFDGGCIHIHGNGRHLLEAVSTLRGLRAIYLGDDRGFPKAFDVLPDLQARTGSVPLVVSAPFGQFVEKLNRHELPGRVLYKVSGADSIGTVNRLMEQVRSYRA
ncbi:MAG: hypothetical protein FJ388_15815 [Verrucomicrobia bacterium]|nr:hypothetical protein [Verrucomicrobiota bacterium]